MAGRPAAARRRLTTEAAALGELVSLPVATPDAEPAWHLYVVRHERADRLATALHDAGIESRAYYRTPVHLQPAMAPYTDDRVLPATADAARTHLAIPMSPVLGADAAAEVAATAARSWFRPPTPISGQLERSDGVREHAFIGDGVLLGSGVELGAGGVTHAGTIVGEGVYR